MRGIYTVSSGVDDHREEPGVVDQREDASTVDQRDEPGGVDQREDASTVDHRDEPGGVDQREDASTVDQREEAGPAAWPGAVETPTETNAAEAVAARATPHRTVWRRAEKNDTGAPS